MNYANTILGIILNGLKKSLKGRKENYTHEKEFIKGDIEVRMPKVRAAKGPFYSKILPPRITQMEEIQKVIPLLYMNGISTRKVKKSVAKLLGKKGLSHQNIIRISNKVVEEFNKWKKLEEDKNHQCCREEFQGGEKKDKRNQV